MPTKILKFILSVILIILPFFAGIFIAKYSPYVEGNVFNLYLWAWTLASIMSIGASLLLIKYVFNTIESFFSFEVLLFCLAIPIIGIVGLAAPPDLSINLLQHPEREHLRYTMLFLGAALFGLAFMLFWYSNNLKFSSTVRWLMLLLFLVSIGEMIYEFRHHYLFPEGMKDWIDEGNKAEDFERSYDTITILGIGAMGRFFQFVLIALFSITLYRMQKVKVWSPIFSTLIALFGIVSAAMIYVTALKLPQGYEFLFLFFIPGILFILLYMIGVALLTHKSLPPK